MHFEEGDGKGRIVVLPEGAEVRVTGPARLRECFEVVFENRYYSIFKVDLLGPRSSRSRSEPWPPKEFALSEISMPLERRLRFRYPLSLRVRFRAVSETSPVSGRGRLYSNRFRCRV